MVPVRMVVNAFMEAVNVLKPMKGTIVQFLANVKIFVRTEDNVSI